jgi:CRP-like cAMP-binding protein
MSLIERFGRNAAAGSVLFREGDAGGEMYVLQSGKVRLTRSIRGTEKLLAELGAGEFFGEMSIINDRPRTATALVLEDAQLLVLDPRTFEAMIKANTEIAVRMIKKFAKRLDDANVQIETLLLHDANSRIVHALLSQLPKDGTAAVVKTNLEDLHRLTGVEEPKIREVIERLSRAKLALPVDEGLSVPDVKKLEEFLEFLELRDRFGDG